MRTTGFRSSGYSYPVRRPISPPRESFADYSSFLRDRALAAGAQRSLCQVMDEAARQANALTGQRTTSEWTNFPWLTPVLGSGALEIPDRPEKIARELATGVRERIREIQKSIDFPWDSTAPLAQTMAEHFALNLALDRLGVGRETAVAREGRAGVGDSPSVSVPVDDITAVLALLTAVLSRSFHLGYVHAIQPESRRVDSIVLLPTPNQNDDPAEAGSWTTTRGTVLSLVRWLLGSLDRSVPGIQAITAKILARIREDYQQDEPQISGKFLGLLTEVAWHYEAQHLSIYPGWSDLLLGVMLETGEDIEEMGSRRPQPKVTNLNGLAEIVKGLMMEATEASWNKRRGDVTGDESDQSANAAAPVVGDVAGAVANVLWSQAAAIERVGGVGVERLPAAVGFVTSFDIEMEMALASLGGSRPFYVVVPVHIAMAKATGSAELFWLVGTISGPVNSLGAMLSPSDWRVLSSGVAFNRLGLSPIVIHLNGAPLIQLPNLRDSDVLLEDLRSLGVGIDAAEKEDGGSGIEMTHAVVVDEYLAMRHAEAEFFWSARDSVDAKQRIGRALPIELSQDSRNCPRYWVALGVAFGDPAVRHRLVSQMTLRRMSQMSAPSRPVESTSLGRAPGRDASDAPEGGSPLLDPVLGAQSSGVTKSDVIGVAVNKRIEGEEAALLHWLGLDVAEDDCARLVKDLQHYCRHLNEDGARKHPPQDETCPLLRVDA